MELPAQDLTQQKEVIAKIIKENKQDIEEQFIGGADRVLRMSRFLQELKVAGCKLHICTQEFAETVVSVLEAFNLRGHFDVIYGCMNTRETKRDHCQELQHRYGAHAREVILLDDRIEEIEDVRSGGFAAIHITDNFSQSNVRDLINQVTVLHYSRKNTPEILDLANNCVHYPSVVPRPKKEKSSNVEIQII